MRRPFNTQFPKKWTIKDLRDQVESGKHTHYGKLCTALGLVAHDNNLAVARIADTFNIDLSHLKRIPKFTPYSDRKKEALITREGGVSYRCTQCDKILPLTEFCKSNVSGVDGHDSRCNPCKNRLRKAYPKVRETSMSSTRTWTVEQLREAAPKVTTFLALTKMLGLKHCINDEIRKVAKANGISLDHFLLNQKKTVEQVTPTGESLFKLPKSVPVQGLDTRPSIAQRMQERWIAQKSLVRTQMLEDVINRLNLLGVEYRVVKEDGTVFKSENDYEKYMDQEIGKAAVGDIVTFKNYGEHLLDTACRVCERIYGRYSHHAIWSKDVGIELMRIR